MAHDDGNNNSDNSNSKLNLSNFCHNMRSSFQGKTMLFYYPSMEAVAKQICKQSNGEIILGKIDWKHFEDGFPDLFIHNAWHIRWCYVVFLCDMSHLNYIFEQYSIISSLPKLLAKSFKIFVPYFSTAQMERVEHYGQVATAKTLARLLSNIPSHSNGPTQLCICDIHALQNQFYFDDNILLRLETCIPLLLHEINNLSKQYCEQESKSDIADSSSSPSQIISIAFPDDGAQKRFSKFFHDFSQITCIKRREGEKRIIDLKEGNVKNQHVIIVDDLVQSGETLANCAVLLKKLGAKSIHCYVTHAVFPDQSWKRFCENGKNSQLFDNFFITDTIPNTAKQVENKKPFKILSIASIILATILDTDNVVNVEQ